MNYSQKQKKFLAMCAEYEKKQKDYERLAAEWMQVQYQARHVHGIQYDAIPVQNHEFDWTIWEEKERRIQTKMERCVRWIRTFESLFQCADGWLLWSIYVNHVPVKEMAGNLHMSANALSRRMQCQIRELFTDEV